MRIADRAYDLSVRIAEIVRCLKEDDSPFALSDRLLDCGVRAGLSVREGDWRTAAEQLRQADYILEMAVKSGYLTERQGAPIRADCAGLLTALQKRQTQ